MADYNQRQDLINKFKSEVDQADWEMLRPHYERGALFRVSENVDIFEVAASLALDDVHAVKGYLELNQIRKADESDYRQYIKDKNKFFANFIVVQPYVLFQPYLSEEI